MSQYTSVNSAPGTTRMARYSTYSLDARHAALGLDVFANTASGTTDRSAAMVNVVSNHRGIRAL